MKKNIGTKYDCFSNVNRVRLIICLESTKCVNDLLLECDFSQSALSQHLKILKDAGIVSCTRNGQKQMYKTTNKEALIIAKKIINLE